ncbi:TetR family transcriptional regulator [Streptomyces tauricus]|uniref:TetR/AcrR family transcriptional regulator n=1 Tax=Streptomyces tauricus TaxID=68274 RepID=A0ABZ1JGL8_9ACTN|nr:TetR/AcrR family transcriptional regulator [Streptomyces tauricus]MCW8095685.1 TetR/AcrR family transcriptional regulator [Streptomyces tauricus]GHA19167.1 TetR family transcriptional regulator [Streptomyces tauricus]
MTRLDGRVERGNRTRQSVLRRTVDIASAEGLEALSVGRLATELGLSKSGVFALFGSKEELQLATVREASRVYVEQVIAPAAELPAGTGRLWRLCERWLDYSRGRVFPGGCFFYEVIAEFDARTGPVHDAVAEAQRAWTAHVEQVITEARDLGELHADTDVPQLAFELVALMESANAVSVLHDESVAYRRARVAIATRLRAAATDPASAPEPSPAPDPSSVRDPDPAPEPAPSSELPMP